jgi:hypothetical protein
MAPIDPSPVPVTEIPAKPIAEQISDLVSPPPVSPPGKLHLVDYGRAGAGRGGEVRAECRMVGGRHIRSLDRDHASANVHDRSAGKPAVTSDCNRAG